MLRSEAEQVAEAREEYLAVVSQMIAGKFSALEAYESVQEMRAHIDATAAAYEELGYEPSEAVRLALAKFGDAQQLGVALCRSVPPAAEPMSGSFLTVRVRVADLITVPAVAVGGAVGMLLADVLFQRLGTVSFVCVEADLMIGGPFGLLIGAYATFSRSTSIRVGMWSAAAIGFLLLYIEAKPEIERHRSLQLFGTVAVLSLIAFLLGFYGKRFGNYLRRSMESDVAISSQAGMT